MHKQCLFSHAILLLMVALAPWGWTAPVTFNDAALLNRVKAQWEAATGLTLSNPPEDTELANPLFTSLTAKGLAITELTGLEACTALTDLNLGMNQISDLGPLSGLTSLITLDLGFGQNFFNKGGGIDPFQTGTNLITDITPLAGLVNLEYLSLLGNDGLTSIAAVSTLDSLDQLWISSSPITDFSPLSGVADTLTSFFDIKCGLKDSDIPLINGLTNLSMLFIFAETNVSDISGLTALNPRGVIFVACPISDINVMANWTNLSAFIGNQTQITNFDALSGLANLQQVEASECLITGISGIANLPNLKTVRLDKNQIVDIAALQNLPAVEEISLNDNLITDIQALVDNTSLGGNDRCYLNNNPLSEDAVCNQLPALRAKFSFPEYVESNVSCGPTYTLTVTINGIGETTPSAGVYAIQQNTSVSLNASLVAGSGYAFSGWTGDVTTGQTNTQIYMDSDKSVTANFVPGGWTLTITTTGDLDGNTWYKPGVYSYLDGQTATVSMWDNNGMAFFNGWSGDATGFLPMIQVLMDANKTVNADFASAGYKLDLSVQGMGVVKGFFLNGPSYFKGGVNFNLQAESVSSLFRFDHWEGDIGVGADSYNPVLPVTMDQDRGITAVFVEDSRTLMIIIDGAGNTNPAGSTAPGTQYTYPVGQGVCVNAVLSEGVALDYWSGDIGGMNPNSFFCCVIMDQDRTITAHFVEADWNLTIGAGGNGDTTPVPGIYGFVNGALANCTARLISGGDAFDQWTGDLMPGSDPQEMDQSLTMSQNRSVSANFVPGDWTLTLAKTGDPDGNIIPAPGAYAYLNGRTARVQANTNVSAYFAGWTGDVTSGNLYLDVVMDGHKSLTANYAGAGYVLNVSVDGQGTLSPGGNGFYYFANGLEPVLTAIPQNGYVFDYWSGDLPFGADPNNPVLPVLMDQARSLIAHFTIQPAVLTLIIEGQGSTHPAGGPAPGIQYTYPLGQQIWVVAEPGGNGWAFAGWSGDVDTPFPDALNLQLTMDRDRTLVANYVAADWTLTLAYTGNGSTWPAPGTYGYLDGANVEAVAGILNGGDAFNHWEGVLTSMDPYDPGQRFIIRQDMTLTAVFTPGEHTLTTTVLGGGAAEYVSHPAGVYQYMDGRYANLEVRPWTITFWGGYSGDVNSFDYTYSLLMDGDKNVTITLGASGYQLTVNQVGFGRTNPSGTAGFVAGATPAIHALDQGSALFDYWSGDLPPGMDPTNRDSEILMDQNRTITANFVEADFYLYIQVIGNGTTAPAPALYWHRNGDAFTVSATPGGDFLFLQWQGNVPAGQDPASPSISGTITQNVELIAVFVPSSVTVPDLSGKNQAEAEAALAVLGLALGDVTQEYSDTVPLGHVISQDPVAAASVPYGSAVSIVVSSGPCIAPVPNLVGLTQAEAETALAAAHLILGVLTQENSETVPAGQIIRQEPVFGLVVACDTAVAVVVSLGPVIEGEGEEGEGETGCHTADQNCDGMVNLSELLRVIQFFNSGGYHCEVGTEDGYAPGPGDTNCTPHISDYMPQDWQINLSELLRLIQFFNSGGYHYCPAEATEDGFCPGL